MTGPDEDKDFIHQPRRDRMYEEHQQDPYRSRGKLPEPTVCGDCAAVYLLGRWQWGDAPAAAHEHRCPACSRIHDKVPAGLLTLRGAFMLAHRDEIMALIHHTEAREKSEHPLERIMLVEESADGASVVVSYTGVHLAKSTGTALQRAYGGAFDFQYVDSDGVMSASWER